MAQTQIRVLRVLIAGMIGGCLLVIGWVLPESSGSVIRQVPELAAWRWPYTILGMAGFVCVIVVLIALWKLLEFVGRGEIFRDRAVKWVNLIIGAGGVATLLAVGTFVSMWYLPTGASPGPPLLLMGLSGGGLAFVLLMVVMKSLLRQAMSMESELAEVI